MPKQLNLAHRLWAKQYITANPTNFRWHVINYDNAISLAYSMHNLTLLILSRAAYNIAFHLSLLCVGLTHFGGRGSYTVIIISSGCAVVQTICQPVEKLLNG